MPIGREDAPLAVEVAPLQGDGDGHPSGQGHLALVEGQGLAGLDDGDQGGGAGGLEVKGGAAEVQAVRDPGGEEVGAIAGEGLVAPLRIPQVLALREVLEQVGGEPRPAEDPDDGPLWVSGGEASIDKGVIAMGEEEAVLGVEEGPIPWAHAEEAVVKAVSSLQGAFDGDEVLFVQERLADPGLLEGGALVAGEALFAFHQEAPEGGHIGGPREGPRETDKGDGVVGIGSMGRHEGTLRA